MLEVPSLRERREDIALLVEHFRSEVNDGDGLGLDFDAIVRRFFFDAGVLLGTTSQALPQSACEVAPVRWTVNCFPDGHPEDRVALEVSASQAGAHEVVETA